MATVTKNKRHGPDPIVRGKKLMIGLAWLFILLIIIMFGYAEPHMNIPIYSGGTSGGASWDRSMLRYAYLLMFPLAVTSAVGLVFNSWRNNRKYDYYSKTLIMSMLLSVLGIVSFSIYFFVS